MEDFLDPAHQAPALGPVVDLADGIELFEEFALALGEFGRRLHLDFDEEIAASAAIEHGDSLLSQAEACSSLRPLRNLQQRFALKSGDLNLGTERRLRVGDGNDAVEIFAFALEEWVLLHVKHDVNVP